MQVHIKPAVIFVCNTCLLHPSNNSNGDDDNNSSKCSNASCSSLQCSNNCLTSYWL